MPLQSMTIRARLALAFAATSVMMLGMAAMAIHALQSADERFASFVHGNYQRLMLSYEVRGAIERRAVAARDLIHAPTPEARDIVHAEVVKAHRDAQQRLAELQKLSSAPDVSEEARKRIAAISVAEQRYAPVALDIVDMAMRGLRDEAVEKMNAQCRPKLAALNETAQAYRDYTVDRAEQFVAQAEQGYLRQRNWLLAGCALAFACAIFASIRIIRSLWRALGAEPAALSAVVGRVAQGDLSPVAGAAQAPRESVLALLGEMQQGLSQMVG